FAPGLKDNFKINDLQTKYILRNLARRYLPENLINQPKRGFEVPLKKWMETELKEIVKDYLLSGSAIYPQLVEKAFVENLLSKKVKISGERRAKILYNIFAMEVWYKNLKSNMAPLNGAAYRLGALQLS